MDRPCSNFDCLLDADALQHDRGIPSRANMHDLPEAIDAWQAAIR